MTLDRRVALRLGGAALGAGFALRALSLTRTGPSLARIGALPLLVSGLALYAHEAGLTGEYGVASRLIEYGDGARAMTALGRGEVDFATASDYSVLVAASRDPRVRILSELASSAINLILARRDRGIAVVADLAGKRIGYSFGSLNDVLLPAFLAREGLAPGAVTLVDLPLGELVGALSRGAVDAILLWDAPALAAQSAFGDRVVAFPVRHHAMARFLLATRDDVSADNPELVEGVLSSLVEAQNVLDRAPNRFGAVLADALGVSDKLRATSLSTVLLGAGLGQALLSVLERRSRFAVGAGLIAPDATPDLLRLVDTAPLRRVAPELVTVLE